LNALLSTWDGIAPFVAMSATMFFKPASRLAPPLASVLRSAAGLPKSVFVGASASVSSDAANRTRCLVRWSSAD